MFTRIRNLSILTGIAFLISTPNVVVIAGTLRDEAVSYRDQGFALQQQGDKAGALAFYQKATNLNPVYPVPWNDAGILLEEAGRFEDAERAYQQALTVDPNYLATHANLALLYERLGNREKAIEQWLKRYQFGEWDDPGTARAGERLVAFGILNRSGLKTAPYTRRHVLDREFGDYGKSLKEFHTITERHGDWP